MKFLTFILVACLICINSHAQETLSQLAASIDKEGRHLYRLEMASWHGTDIFREKYKGEEKVGAWFSYADGDAVKCVYYSGELSPQILGTIAFDSTFNIKSAKVDITKREFTALERELYILRERTSIAIRTDTFFKAYPKPASI